MIDKSSLLNMNLQEVTTQGCVMTATESLLVQELVVDFSDVELYMKQDDGWW